MIEGYEARRDDFPAEWVDRVEVKVNQWSKPKTYGGKGYAYGGGNYYSGGMS